MPDDLTVSVEECAALLGIGRDLAYSALSDPGYISAGPIRLHPIRVGSRLRFGRAAIARFCAAIEDGPLLDAARGEGPGLDRGGRPGRVESSGPAPHQPGLMRQTLTGAST